MKNITLIISLFYIFESITVEFLKSYLDFILNHAALDRIELIMIMIQNTGMKIRGDNPKILKEMIEKITNTLKSDSEQGKEKYLLETLYDIRMNKKIKGDPTERLQILVNFVRNGIL